MIEGRDGLGRTDQQVKIRGFLVETDTPGFSARKIEKKKDRKQKNPNTRRTHAPIDIGDQYLNIGRYVLLSIIMCQKRSGLPRSAVSKMPLTATQGNAT